MHFHTFTNWRNKCENALFILIMYRKHFISPVLNIAYTKAVLKTGVKIA